MIAVEFVCDTARHLVCRPYSIENLHAMAAKLGIKRCWFHNAVYPHYDIPKRRIAEIAAQCTIVATPEIVRIIKGRANV